MRHGRKIHKLSKAADQRKALLRTLASQLFLKGEITTTMARAKALKPFAESIIGFAKKGDLASRRLAGKYIFDKEIGNFINVETGEIIEAKSEDKKVVAQTVLRKLFSQIGKKYQSRQGGYTRIFRLPPRRGDAAEMALIQLV